MSMLKVQKGNSVELYLTLLLSICSYYTTFEYLV